MKDAVDIIDRARRLLDEPTTRPARATSTLGAALLAAMAAVLMAGVVIMGPTLEINDPATPLWLSK